MRVSVRTLLTGAAVLLAGGLASGESASPRSGCARLAAAGAEGGPLAEGQREGIVEALQNEYQGEAIYARVLEDLGEVRPFSNVVHAEKRHAAMLGNLLVGRGLSVPENRWSGAEVPTFASRQEACRAAVDLEDRNVALYDRLLAAGSLPEDVRLVFEHNRTTSLDHHRPAFERCAGPGGPGAVAWSGGGCGRRARAASCDSGGCRECGGGCGPGRGRGAGRGWGRGAGGPTASAPAGSGS